MTGLPAGWPAWHRLSQHAFVYQVYVRSFQDADRDGVGDLRGLTSRLDHLTWLGVDAVWVSPIYPSPLADFGYDVTHHAAQPDLDCRQPDVAPATFDVARTWLDRGADGFRLDALTALLKDPALPDDGVAREPFALPLHPQRAQLDPRRSRNSPELPALLARLRELVDDRFLVGEVGLPTRP